MNDEPIRSSLLVGSNLVLSLATNTNRYFILVRYLYKLNLSRVTICQFIYKEIITTFEFPEAFIYCCFI